MARMAMRVFMRAPALGLKVFLTLVTECRIFHASSLRHSPTPDLLTLSYLQKEIRAGRRNVDALKLSNLLQFDRFEEDLNI
jgi:hypothetical protein